MATIRQYQFGYKEGQKPVQTAVCEASSLEIAEKVARAWCAKQLKQENPASSFRYCFIRPVVVADESILEGYVNPDAPARVVPQLPIHNRQ